MAWVLGASTEQEVKTLHDAGYEVTSLEAHQETALFGGIDEERSSLDKLVMVWVDCDVTSLLEVEK